VVLAVSAGVKRSAPSAGAPVDALAAGLNESGFDLWGTRPVDENLVFSFSSIGHALLMARAAADESTGAAIDRALGLPAGVASHLAWNNIDQLITASDEAEPDVMVSAADRIWPRIDVTPDQGWVDLLAAEHGATTKKLDFAAAPKQSRELINGWVAKQTKGLITDLLPDGAVDGQTVLVLTDALYFKAEWQRPFGKYGPVRDVFTRLDGSTTRVSFMQELELGDKRGRGDGFVGAEIPYAGGAFSMLVIVPERGRFAEIRHRLD
jgi:serpin B